MALSSSAAPRERFPHYARHYIQFAKHEVEDAIDQSFKDSSPGCERHAKTMKLKISASVWTTQSWYQKTGSLQFRRRSITAFRLQKLMRELKGGGTTHIPIEIVRFDFRTRYLHFFRNVESKDLNGHEDQRIMIRPFNIVVWDHSVFEM